MTPFNMVEQSSCPSFSKSELNYFNNITTLIPAEKACVCILIKYLSGASKRLHKKLLELRTNGLGWRN